MSSIITTAAADISDAVVIRDAPAFRDNPAALADEINAAVRDAKHAAGQAVQHALRAGALLVQAKELAPHGHWDSWLQANCEVAPRTARAYMALAKRLPELGIEERQRVADLPLREAIKAITTSPIAPPRDSSYWHRPRRDGRQRAADALREAATAQRKLALKIEANYIKRMEVERARSKMRAALAALDDLQQQDDVVDAEVPA